MQPKITELEGETLPISVEEIRKRVLKRIDEFKDVSGKSDHWLSQLTGNNRVISILRDGGSLSLKKIDVILKSIEVHWPKENELNQAPEVE